MHLKHLTLVALSLLLAGCSAARWEQPQTPSPAPVGSTPRADVVAPAPGDMTRSRRGNPPFYEVYGVRYHVMNTSEGYRERGVASWYGKKFHGRDTSSGEPYDMYQMTAAHNTLPLPTNVRVTNLSNGRSIIVRVNDRGPFVKNRVIDLSYAAARELDMITSGTAMVEVEALPVRVTGPATTLAATSMPESPAQPPRLYVQVGAFGEVANAQNLARQLNANGIAEAAVHQSEGEMPQLYRVRIGPFSNAEDFDRMVARVQGLQFAEARLVVESSNAVY